MDLAVRSVSEEEFEAKWPYVFQNRHKRKALLPHTTAYTSPDQHWGAAHDETLNQTETSWAKVTEIFGASFLGQDSVEECIYDND